MSEPAFPVSALVYNEQGKDPTTIIHDGISIRDYFAAKAMQGFLATVKVGCPDDLIAIDAYNLADAMLKARQA